MPKQDVVGKLDSAHTTILVIMQLGQLQPT